MSQEPPLIDRANIVDVLEEQLAGDLRALVIDADDGDGKSTIVRSYCASHRDNTIHIELTAASRWSYEPTQVINTIAVECCRLLNDTSWPHDHIFAESDLGPLYIRLRRRAATRHKAIVLAIDGLHEIPRQDTHTVTRILQMLPFGLPGVKVLLTDTVPATIHLPATIQSRTWRLTRFTTEQSCKYLAPFAPNEQALQLHTLCGGRPGSLAAIRRLLHGGHSVTSLLSSGSGEIHRLLELEWDTAGLKDDIEHKILALVALSFTPITALDVSSILAVPEPSVDRTIQKCGSLIALGPSNTLSIPHESCRKFILTKVDRLRDEVLGRMIAHLQRSPTSGESLRRLPRYFQAASRPGDLLKYLSPENLLLIADQADSLDPLADTLRAGADAAISLDNDPELYRLALHSAGTLELGRASHWDGYVRSSIALNEFSTAISIADSSRLLPEKMLLLGRVAAGMARAREEDRHGIIPRIQRLLGESSHILTPGQALALAGRLFALMPKEAMTLIQQASKSPRPGNTVDWAVAQMVMSQAVHEKQETEIDSRSTHRKSELYAYIRDPEVGRITLAASESLRSVTAEHAITQARSISQARDVLYFYRQWATLNSTRQDAIRVTHAALDVIIATTEYSPNARDVLMIAQPLRYSDDFGMVERASNRIEAMLGDISERGPTAELHRLRILIAAVKFRWHQEPGRSRLVAECNALKGINDPAVRAECYAHLLATLTDIDVARELERTADMHTLAALELESAVLDALGESGSHEEILSPVIEAAARNSPGVVRRLIDSVNTRARREELRSTAVREVAVSGINTYAMASVREFIGSCESDWGRANCIRTLWELWGNRTIPDECDLLEFEGLASLARDRLHDGERVLGTARVFACAVKSLGARCPAVLQGFGELALAEVNLIDDAWEARSAALDAAEIVAAADPGVARKFLAKAHEIEQLHWGGKYTPAEYVIPPIRLTILALIGLMRRSGDQEADRTRVIELMLAVPSAVRRISLLAECAVWAYSVQRIEECNRITDEYILPEIRKLEQSSQHLFAECVVSASDALYIGRRATAYELFKKLDGPERDSAAQRAARARIARVPSVEPVRMHGGVGNALSQEDVEELLKLSDLCESDHAAMTIVAWLGDAILKTKRPLSQHQRQVAAAALKESATRTLPRPGWIAHDGYGLLWRALAKRIGDKPLLSNDEILREMESIPNKADRSYVFAHVAERCASQCQADVLKKAASLAHELRIEGERIEHLTGVAERAMELDAALGKRLAADACTASDKSESNAHPGVHRRVLDAAYRSNRDLAGAFAETLDTDPVRIAARVNQRAGNARDHIGEMKLLSQLVEPRTSGPFSEAEIEALPRAAWKGLASLNAGKREPQRLEDLRWHVRAAAEMPLRQAFPVLAWCLGNIRLRVENTDRASLALRPLLDASYSVARCALEHGATRNHVRHSQDRRFSDGLVVGSGDESDVAQFLDQWIEKSVVRELLICDPYIQPRDLWLLKSVLKHAPQASIYVVTKRLSSAAESESARDRWRSEWARISDMDAPWTEVISVELAEEATCPFHDRWLIADNGGLNLGTSIGGLGRRESIVREMSPGELGAVRSLMEGYSRKARRRTDDNRQIRYESFLL